MGAKSTFLENGILNLIFNGTSIPGIADNTATSPITTLYVSLHTASPGAGGSQTTNEATYTGYARQAVPRNASGWVFINGAMSPVNTITFPACLSGNEIESFMGIGTTLNGTGILLYFGPILPTITIISGVTPQLLPATQVFES